MPSHIVTFYIINGGPGARIRVWIGGVLHYYTNGQSELLEDGNYVGGYYPGPEGYPSPHPWWRFKSWAVTGGVHGDGFNFSVDGNGSLTLTCESDLLITVNTHPSGLDAPSGGGYYWPNDTANISVSAVEGYPFQRWNRDGTFYTYSQAFSYVVDAAHTFTAVLLPSYTVTFYINNGGPGAFIRVWIGGVPHYYTNGQSVVLEHGSYAIGNYPGPNYPSPHPWWQFKSWSTTGGVHESGNEIYLDGNGSLTLTCESDLLITVNTSPGGLDAPSGGGYYWPNGTANISVSAVGGYTFVQWNRDGAFYTSSQSFSYQVDAAHTFTAVFQALAPQYTIAVNTSPPSLDAPYGGGTYDPGQTAYIGVSSVGGYTFLYWNRDGSLYTYSQTFSYVVEASHTFTAVFQAIPQYTIIVNTSPGGLDSPYGGGTYTAGQTANIGVSSVPGYTFQYWTRDGSIYTYSQAFSYVVDASRTFTAIFQAIPQYTISVGTSPPGLDAPSGGGTYYQGTNITISVSSVVGKTFQYWNRDGSFYTYNQTFGYNVEAAHTFTAVFTVTQCVITVNTSPGGLDAPSGAGTYDYGTNISIGVSNVAHYNFLKWNRDAAFYTSNQTFGYFVDTSRTFTAVFSPIAHAIDAVLKKLGITKTVGADVTFVMRFAETYSIDAALEGPAASPISIDAALKAVNIVVLSKTNDVRLRSALGVAKDVYLYPTIFPTGYSVGMSLRQWLGIRKLFATDIALKQIDLSAGHGINVRLATLSGRSKDVDIDAALKELSLSELHEIDVALEKFGLTNYHSDVLLVLRSRVNLAIDAAIEGISSASHGIDVSIRRFRNIPRFVSIGMYLLSPQKFDLSVSFEQFEANPSFESLSVVSSFESLEVTPYFKEV